LTLASARYRSRFRIGCLLIARVDLKYQLHFQVESTICDFAIQPRNFFRRQESIAASKLSKESAVANV